MVARLNIKNAEAHAIASELARMAGVSMTQVVVDALQARKQELSSRAKQREFLSRSGHPK